MKRYFIYVICLFLLVCCKSTGEKHFSSKKAPYWVGYTPVNTDYYIGIYSVSKAGADFRRKAKQGALESLASEISVKISGESVLKTLETGNSFDQDYKQNIRIKTTEEIEGYELVGTWENDLEYWVYYRLSKVKYAQIKTERIEHALNIGKDFFHRAKENHDKNNYHEAFVLSIKALESVSKYLDQPLKTSIEGENVYFATEVMSYAQEMVGEIRIVPGKREISVLLGDVLGVDEAYFVVRSDKGVPLSQIPLKCEHKAIFFKNYNIQTNAFGHAGVSIGKIKQSKKEQFITAKLDFEELAFNQTKDKIVLKLLNYIPAKTSQIKLNVRAPNVYVISNEKEFGRKINPMIAPVAKQVLISRGLKVVNKKSDADLIMVITSNTKLLGSHGGTYQVELKGNIEVKKVVGGEVVFSEVIQSSKGLQLNKKRASLDAYSKAETYVKRRLIPKLANQYFAF